MLSFALVASQSFFDEWDASVSSLRLLSRNLASRLQTVPPQLAASDADLHPRRIYGDPKQDAPRTQSCIFAVASGAMHAEQVNRTISRLPLHDFQPVLFVYDGRPEVFSHFHWSPYAIIIAVKGQSKWWFARRFLHPEVVRPYEYVMVWDEDIELPPGFDPNGYVRSYHCLLTLIFKASGIPVRK